MKGTEKFFYVLEGLLGTPRQHGDACILAGRQLAAQHCCCGVWLHEAGV